MTSINFLPVIVTDIPNDEDHAPLLVDPAAARIVRADQVTAGDTVLAGFATYLGDAHMPQADYFNDQYAAHPVTYNPACCVSCDTMAGHYGQIVNLGDINHWGTCDLWNADDLVLIVPAAA